MKIVRMQTSEGISYGTVEPEGIRVYQGSPLVHWEATDVFRTFGEVTLLAPVLPTKVVCVGGTTPITPPRWGATCPTDRSCSSSPPLR